MNRMIAACIFVVASVFAAACSSDGSSRALSTRTPASAASATTKSAASTATPRPTHPPATPAPDSPYIDGPLAQSSALTGNTVSKQFIVDRVSGEMWVVSAGHSVEWHDDGTLLLPCASSAGPFPERRSCGYWLLRLDDDTQLFVNEVPPTPTPASPPSSVSADGAWRLVTGGDTVYVEDTANGRRIDLPANETFAWSPVGHVLATGGGRCGNVPITFVDPDAVQPVRTADVGTATIRTYAWAPDGSGIALAVFRNSAQAQILFVSTTGAIERVLAPVGPAQIRGEPMPGAWNAAGTRLLFRIYSGRPCPF